MAHELRAVERSVRNQGYTVFTAFFPSEGGRAMCVSFFDSSGELRQIAIDREPAMNDAIIDKRVRVALNSAGVPLTN